MQINIGFGINDSFSQHCGVTIASILKSSSLKDSYKFFIIYKNISDENKAKFEELKKIRDFEIEFVQIDDKILKKVKFDKSLAIEQSYQVFLYSFTCVDKLLYIDSDIVVRKDIAEVYNIDIEDYYLAGVEDVSSEYSKTNCSLSEQSVYVNSGLILINLKKTREIDHFEFLQNLPKDLKEINFSYQDVINYIYQEKILLIDIKYNYMYPYYNSYQNQEYYHNLSVDPYSIHYLTANKPWVPGSSPYRKEEYFKYLKLTPWYKEFLEMYQIEENIEILKKLNNMSYRTDEISNKLNEILARFGKVI